MSSSKSQPDPPALGANGGASADGGGNRNRRRCSIPNCPKQSQGGRNKDMCRLHFKEWATANPDLSEAFKKKSLVAATMVGMGGAGGGERMKMDGGGQRRTLCKTEGCPKQSQGGRCNYMCAAHYNEEVKANSGGGGAIPPIGARGKLAGASTATGSKTARAASARRTTATSSGAKRKSHHPLCAREGCPKQSQGGRCNNMCASHYKEQMNQNGVQPPAPSAATAAASSERPRKTRRNPNGGHHPLCSVMDCPKQSQGSRCNFMCAAHYKEQLAANSGATLGVEVGAIAML